MECNQICSLSTSESSCTAALITFPYTPEHPTKPIFNFGWFHWNSNDARFKWCWFLIVFFLLLFFDRWPNWKVQPTLQPRGAVGPTHASLYCKQQWSVIFEKTQMRHRWTQSHQSFVVCTRRVFWIPPSLPTSSNSLAAGGVATMFNAPCGVRSLVSERKPTVRTRLLDVPIIPNNRCAYLSKRVKYRFDCFRDT